MRSKVELELLNHRWHHSPLRRTLTSKFLKVFVWKLPHCFVVGTYGPSNKVDTSLARSNKLRLAVQIHYLLIHF